MKKKRRAHRKTPLREELGLLLETTNRMLSLADLPPIERTGLRAQRKALEGAQDRLNQKRIEERIEAWQQN